MNKLLQYLGVASILLLCACVTTVTRGHLKEDEALSNIVVGKTTKAETMKTLGSPSSESTFGPSTWFYMSSIRENRSLFAPEITDQHVIEIAFSDGGVVSNIKEYSLKDGKNIQTATRTTPTEGQSLGFFEQIISNLGRFNNNQDNSASNSHTHGQGPPVVR